MNRLNRIIAAILARLGGGTDHFPVAQNDSYTVAEDNVLSGNLSTNDTPSADGGNVWTLGAQAAHGTAVVNADGTFTYTPAANYNGPDSFTYALTDTDGDVSVATVTLTVSSVDDLPVAVNDTFTVVQDNNLTGNLATNDTLSGDGGNNFSKVSGPSHGTATVNSDGTFTYSPTAGYFGSDSFVYRITDTDGDVSTATANITITQLVVNPLTLSDILPYKTGTYTWRNIPYGSESWFENSQTLFQQIDIDLPTTAAPPLGYPVVIYFHPNGSTKFITNGSIIDTARTEALAAGFAFMSVEFRHPVVNVSLGAPHNDTGYAIQMCRAVADALNLDDSNYYGISKSRGSLCLWQSLQPDLVNPTGPTWQSRQSSWLQGIWTHAAQTTYSTTEFANTFIKVAQRAGFLAANPDDSRWGSALQSVATATNIPYLTILHADAYPTGLINAGDANEHFSGFGSAMLDQYVSHGYTAKITAHDLIPDTNSYIGAVAWFTSLYNASITQTVKDLGLLGGQPAIMLDYAAQVVSNDLMKRIRGTGTGAGTYYDTPTLLSVSSMVRTTNVTTVTIASPANAIYTGQLLILTNLFDSTFDVEYVQITRLTNTTFTYPNTASNASYTPRREGEVIGQLLNTCLLNSAGHPKGDFTCVVVRSGGSDTTFPDVIGTYNGVFPGTPPANISGTNITNYTPGGSTFTMTINSGNSGAIDFACTGVPTDNSFRMPTLIRTTDPQDSRFLRPDVQTHFSRYAAIRMMDIGFTNHNGFARSWVNRPMIQNGRGIPVEDMIKICNEANCDMWYCVPTLAKDDYIDGAAALIKANLNPGLNVYFEWSNELWNGGADFEQSSWLSSMTRAHLQSRHYHAGAGFTEIVSLVRTGGSTVTVTLSDACPYTNGQTILVGIDEAGDQSFATANATVAGVSGNTFTYTKAGANGTASFSYATIVGNTSSDLISPIMTDNDSIVKWIYRYTARKVYEIALRVKAVFDNTLNTRARVLLMHQISGTNGGKYAPLYYMLDWIETVHGAPNQWIYGIGAAPYAKAQNWASKAGATDNAKILQAIKDYTDSYLIDRLRGMRYIASAYGMKCLHYEGGPDLIDVSPVSKVNAFWVADEMRQAQEYLLNACYQYGTDLHMQFQSANRWTNTDGVSSWGLGHYMTDLLPIGGAAAPKAQGLDNILAAAPATAPSALTIPRTLNTVNGGVRDSDFDIYFDGGVSNGMVLCYTDKGIFDKLFYCPADGVYNFNIWGHIYLGFGGTDLIRLYLDGVSQGTLAMHSDSTNQVTAVVSGGFASPTSKAITLTKGWHVIRIKSPASPPQMGLGKIVIT